MSRESASIVTANASRQRWVNERAVFQALRTPATITELASRLDLSRTAIEAVVLQLEQLGWVRSTEMLGKRSPGRPARQFVVDPAVALVGSIDIGAHTVRVGIANLAGSVLGTATVVVAESLSAADRLARAAAVFEAMLDGQGLRLEDIWIIAVGVPGVANDGRIAHFIGMQDWQGTDVAGTLRSRFGRPIIVENDCNLAAVAERWIGKAVDVADLVFVLAGLRTGAGIVIDGSLYRGRRGGAGEIGALPQIGWMSAPESIDGVEIGGVVRTREEVFDLARAGDADALAAVDRFAERVATGIAALQLTLDPERIVIGGGVAQAGGLFIEAVRRHADALSVVRAPDICGSELGDTVVVLGGIRMALDHIETRLLSPQLTGAPLPAPTAQLLVDVDKAAI